MNWVRLIDLSDEHMLGRGNLLRCAGKWPYEDIVDFMITDYPNSDRGMTIIVSSGYKGGLMLVSLPKESQSGHENYAGYINTGWLKENWVKWVYPDCPIDKIFVSDGYPAPENLPDGDAQN